MIRVAALLIALLASLAVPGRAQADELRPGYLELVQRGAESWRIVWKAPVKGGVKPETQPILPGNCKLSKEMTREMSAQAVISRGEVRCDGNLAGKKIGLSNFAAAQNDVLVRIVSLAGPVQALRLTADQPMVRIPAKAEQGNVAWTYFVIGIEHIIFGLDHLLFVLCLVMLIGSGSGGGWTVAKTVTAFTVAHSITLAGVTLGWFGLPQQPVEVVIALSIIFLAVEIVKKNPEKPRLSERIPWVVAFVFGLLHGFGFAGALSEIGLPEGEVPIALLTFNLGVEAGQLAIVFIAISALWLLGRLRTGLLIPVTRIASYAIGIVAAVWFIERLIA
ncbi:MAG: HupE/UreJ family protein [Sphingorhabdus sp.]